MIEGKLYEPGGVVALSVTCYVNDDSQLVVSTLDNPVDKSDISVKPKLGNLPREIAFTDGTLLVCPAQTELDSWLFADKGSLLANMESNTRWLLASIVFVPLLLYGLFVHAIPYAAVALADYVPQSIKQEASQQTLAALDYAVLDATELSAEQQASLRMGFESVITDFIAPNIQFNIQFRSSEVFGPNAFALPDGTIVFTDQLVNLVEADQQLLDAILLHEIGHVVQNHSMQLVAESLFATLAISYFFGDLSGAIESFMGIGSTIVHNQFSQQHEWQADNFALEQLLLSGRNTDDFAQAMQKLAELIPNHSDQNQWFQSHPLIDSRIKNAESYSSRNRSQEAQ
ncbi:M48 family metallopeptidase [Alteromonas flava]|uniref:M48 family metallopeptidase n=1 Tax=Alteromonas flava TaxID=2048003 RepID=UPI000C293EC0|nr:M48 family metallopeptidase [Alteromonas flava]